ncbi:MAG: U32 family peptidase [Clostridiales bacterium]|jgi:putative protease|nr:U32 family peptidase [Clostridiales bacterium]
MPEILAPAGNLSKLFTAFHFGADAVYLGGNDFSLRAFADNFDLDDIAKGVKFAHSVKKRVYVAVNVFPRTGDFGRIREYLSELKKIGADAVIASDLGVMNAVIKSGLALHVSTQANTMNAETVKFYRDFGAKRVVLARELSLREIGEIGARADGIELECFVHGAMCISYSGRCLLSNYLAGRDSNRGECVQACRWKYDVRESAGECGKEDGQESGYVLKKDEEEPYCISEKDARKNDCGRAKGIESGGYGIKDETRRSGIVLKKDEEEPYCISEKDARKSGCGGSIKNGRKYEIAETGGENYLEIQEDAKGTYILNGKDLCMINHIGELIAAGVDSFKIEGRMKSEYYVGSVVNAYRRAVDGFLSDGKVKKELFDELKKTGNRGYTTGFYLDENDRINTLSSKAVSEYAFIANVAGQGERRGTIEIVQRNRFQKGDVLEVLSPDENFLRTIEVGNMYGENGEIVVDAKIVKQKIYLETDLELKEFDILRSKIKK